MALTTEQILTAKTLLPIFFPYLTIQRDRMIESGGRFVHYTSAENALKIINTKTIWMRNATCMSDYREVHHGHDALTRYFSANTTAKQDFDAAINECGPNIAEEAFHLFGQWWQNIQLQTYVTSISEHDNREDLHGRLSMWRAFGGATARVAIVIKLNLEVGTNEGFGAVISPVGYFTDNDVARELGSIVNNVRSNREYLRTVDRAHLVSSLFAMLTTGVVSMKHEGFREEREWRVIYSPRRSPAPHIESSIEVVGGVPQIVCKIPFRNDPVAKISGMEPNELLDRVIIGPTQFPWAMYEAFVAALEAAGVQNAAARVFISQIPVRT